MKKTTRRKSKQDWSTFDGMTAEQKRAAALSDPDAQPTPEGKANKVRRSRGACDGSWA